MRQFAILALILVVPALVTAVTAQSDDGKPDPAKQLASLTWLAGNWSGEIWGGTFTAHYGVPSDGMLLSFSELAHGGKVGYHEFERFSVADGAVRMSPYPKGQPADGFNMVKLEGKKATFENPKKDYPTRIVYHRKSETELEITLSDPHGKNEKTDVFKLSRK